MLHRLVQPAYFTFRQQCRQLSNCSNTSSSSGNGSTISRAAAVATQQLQQDVPVHSRLQQVLDQPACCNHVCSDHHSSWNSPAPSNSTAHNNNIHSMQALLSGPLTSSTTVSSISSSAARAPGGSPGPGKPGKDGDEFGPNFGGESAAV
jgi:hypothetical protein